MNKAVLRTKAIDVLEREMKAIDRSFTANWRRDYRGTRDAIRKRERELAEEAEVLRCHREDSKGARPITHTHDQLRLMYAKQLVQYFAIKEWLAILTAIEEGNEENYRIYAREAMAQMTQTSLQSCGEDELIANVEAQVDRLFNAIYGGDGILANQQRRPYTLSKEEDIAEQALYWETLAFYNRLETIRYAYHIFKNCS